MTTEMAQEANAERQLVVFELGTESYGTDIGSVLAIIQMQEITAVPDTAENIDRGSDQSPGQGNPGDELPQALPSGGHGLHQDTRIIVVHTGGSDVGVIVDAVTRVLRIPAQSITDPSSVAMMEGSEYLTGIAKVGEAVPVAV